MEVKAQLRQLRIAPRKVRVVVDQVRGLTVEKAERKLETLVKAAAIPILKLIRSAAANAEHNNKLTKEQLYIKTIRVDEGVALKRWMPRAMGRATPIHKKASHITLILDTKKTTNALKKVKVDTAEPLKKEEVKVEKIKSEEVKSSDKSTKKATPAKKPTSKQTSAEKTT